MGRLVNQILYLKVQKLTQNFYKKGKKIFRKRLLFMEVRKQKSGEERMKEQSTSETVCFAWRNRFCSFLRHKNKPSFFVLFWAMQKEKRVILYRV